MLHDAGFLVVRLLDQEAVVGDVLSAERRTDPARPAQRGGRTARGEGPRAPGGITPATRGRSRCRSQALRPMITTATSQAMPPSTGPLTKLAHLGPLAGELAPAGPPQRRAAGSGSPGSGSAARPAPCSPYIAVTITAGMMAISRVMSRRSQAGRRMLRNPSITIWPGQRPGDGRVLTRGQQRDGEQRAGERGPEQRRQQPVGVADVGHVLVAGVVEGGRRQDQDGRVDEEGEQQRHRRIEGGEPDRLALGRRRRAAPSGSARWTSAGRGCAA